MNEYKNLYTLELMDRSHRHGLAHSSLPPPISNLSTAKEMIHCSPEGYMGPMTELGPPSKFTKFHFILSLTSAAPHVGM